MGIEDGEDPNFGLDAKKVLELKPGDTVLYRKIKNGVAVQAIAEVVATAGNGKKCQIIVQLIDVIEGEEKLKIGKPFWADKSEIRLLK